MFFILSNTYCNFTVVNSPKNVIESRILKRAHLRNCWQYTYRPMFYEQKRLIPAFYSRYKAYTSEIDFKKVWFWVEITPLQNVL